MIEKITDLDALKKFVYFTEKHYAGDELFAPPIYSSFLKELTKLVLEKQTYTALLCYKKGELVGRLLYTVDKSKKSRCTAGFFSAFECIDDVNCARELFLYMEDDLIVRGIDYVEGAYSPYDPDNRTGILVEGFDLPPVIFTSYNYPYYGKLLEELGYTKAHDKVSLRLDLEGEKAKELKSLADSVRERLDIRVDSLDYGNFDRDVDDVAVILKAATSEVNYHEAPSVEMIKKVAKSMKLFLNPRYIKIARENGTDKPVGFCMSIPDFNQILRKTDGRIKPLTMLFGKKKITAVRGMLQYVVPEFQGLGVIAVIFDETYKTFKQEGVTYFEGGTIMEDNKKSIGVLEKFGGEIVKVYRIYSKRL